MEEKENQLLSLQSEQRNTPANYGLIIYILQFQNIC